MFYTQTLQSCQIILFLNYYKMKKCYQLLNCPDAQRSECPAMYTNTPCFAIADTYCRRVMEKTLHDCLKCIAFEEAKKEMGGAATRMLTDARIYGVDPGWQESIDMANESKQIV